MSTEVKLNLVKESPYQGRMIRPAKKDGKTDDPALKQMEESVVKQGLLTPIIVRPLGDGYEIIDGHRRAEVFKRLGRETIPVTVKEVDDQQAQAFSIIGNLHRQNLSTIEKAIAFKRIIETGVYKNVKEFSKAIGKHETFVGDFLNTLEMDRRIIDDIAQNKTTEDVRLLRAIRKVEKAVNNESEKQWELYQEYLQKGLTRNQVLELVKNNKLEKMGGSAVRINRSGKSVSFMIRQVPEEHVGEIQRIIEEYLGGIEVKG